ncbi:putative calcium transporter [Podospora australis]|uniref:Calcium transporter n=1 Tax=Podospora australis TaxID=1536484 RepID=A0AAN7ADG2_9PEZI|nr:putative calcium transporter [Podospora australis]
MSIKGILFYSYLNWLLILVPVGFAVRFAGLPAGVVFGVNAVAIIPLAGLLSHATESVACRMGDTVGALMNVTFGNAVELIIFIIALVKDQIRIVQASLVGSILANVLLILGMCFLLGGLRFREQIYNSTVTQINSSLLALSVMSLLIPTVFHASFSKVLTADDKVLQVSRGTSVVLLVVYLLYLVFQLKSHSYLYESTPQHIIEMESHPGPAAHYFASSSCNESSSSDSEQAMGDERPIVDRGVSRGRQARRASSSNPDTAKETSIPTNSNGLTSTGSSPGQANEKLSKRSQKRSQGNTKDQHTPTIEAEREAAHRVVDFEFGPDLESQTSPPRGALPLSLINMFSARPPLSTNQTTAHIASNNPNSLRRAHSEPLHYHPHASNNPPVIPINLDHPRSTSSPPSEHSASASEQTEPPSPKMAILLLIISTALVALHAEFMISSISSVITTDPGLSEAFIGLIILPIVGNAAEHFTAVSVALKNKMDLAIGVAVGSSIQIALFVTPLIVMLGWVMGKEMSLFFTLFETVCVVVSVLILSFLVLDGRSNYLEGALLCSGYVMIAVAAFFYPDPNAANLVGGMEGLETAGGA